ncbi:hypothetical protein D917_07502 [Trichinella nativa]|uniref:Secreted protein n=1 Tax=Trichinella nativa TaxID=6335 RepID=A0A1Y3ET72_9BILA|nr:hypothetical protein D917_07502 [Trichinella nativa]
MHVHKALVLLLFSVVTKIFAFAACTPYDATPRASWTSTGNHRHLVQYNIRYSTTSASVGGLTSSNHHGSEGESQSKQRRKPAEIQDVPAKRVNSLSVGHVARKMETASAFIMTQTFISRCHSSTSMPGCLLPNEICHATRCT